MNLPSLFEWDKAISIVLYLIILISIIISVSFYTLFERKVLGLRHIRIGPIVVRGYGLIQPFRDAIKLFIKFIIPPRKSNYYLYFITPVVACFRSLRCWFILPYYFGMSSVKYLILLFFILTAVGVYAHLGAGWSSNSNYALIGRLRSIAQRISYEVRFAFLLIILIIWISDFNLTSVKILQIDVFLIFVTPLLRGCWLISCLAETNRSPFDFAEGESELVSGFNVEYGGRGFALLFIGEYARIIFISCLFSCLFLGGGVLQRWNVLITIFIMYFFVWVRVSLPRRRYDKLISLFWFYMLPITLILILIMIILY